MRISPGSRVRCIRPPGREAWAVDGLVGVVIGPACVPVVERGDHGIPAGKGWEGWSAVGLSSVCWDVAIVGFGRGPMPEDRLEPLDGAAEAAASLAATVSA